jgi:hypothetical protein
VEYGHIIIDQKGDEIIHGGITKKNDSVAAEAMNMTMCNSQFKKNENQHVTRV